MTGSVGELARELGHSMVELSSSRITGDVFITCPECRQFAVIDRIAVVDSPDPPRVITMAIESLGPCTASLYRPIPGTPWFEYGPRTRTP